MRVVIMGSGRVGAQIATTLWREGHQVTLMDTEPEAFLLLPREMRQDERTTLLGDGTLDEDLKRADIEEADVFVAVSGRDNRNALAAQKALHHFRVSRVVCRIDDPLRTEMYAKLGLTVVSPTRVSTGLILEAIRA
ncbi:MAG: TrkA family potassium uptake protein [Chloroflexi bacterium]|nr:TrkA family potassium uptake protein [Chloroflexota bacterium]